MAVVKCWHSAHPLCPGGRTEHPSEALRCALWCVRGEECPGAPALCSSALLWDESLTHALSCTRGAVCPGAPLVCSGAYEVCSGVKKPKSSPRREGLGKGSKGPAHPRLVRPAHCEFASITRPACGRAGAGPQRPMHTHKCPAQTRREQAVGQALAKQAGAVNRWRYRFPAATGLSGPRGAHTYDRPTAPLRCGSV